jgi:hypothetical protein
MLRVKSQYLREYLSDCHWCREPVIPPRVGILPLVSPNPADETYLGLTPVLIYGAITNSSSSGNSIIFPSTLTSGLLAHTPLLVPASSLHAAFPRLVGEIGAGSCAGSNASPR